MPRAKPIDRIEFTKRKMQGLNPLSMEAKTPVDNHAIGLSVCPECGQKTLRHEGGCDICSTCGFSSCGLPSHNDI